MSESTQPQQPEKEQTEIDDQDLDSVAGGTSIRLIDTILPIPEPCFPTYPVDDLI